MWRPSYICSTCIIVYIQLYCTKTILLCHSPIVRGYYKNGALDEDTMKKCPAIDQSNCNILNSFTPNTYRERSEQLSTNVSNKHDTYRSMTLLKQVSIKIFLKRNLAHVGMAQCMNALADRVQKQVPCTQWYALHNMDTLVNNHPYISSSEFSANWCASATYVGRWIMWPCYGVYITVCMALVFVHTPLFGFR